MAQITALGCFVIDPDQDAEDAAKADAPKAGDDGHR